jgi:biotin transport system substrate-specific component
MERVQSNVLASSFIAAFMGGVIALYIPGVIGMALVLDKSLVAAFGLVSAFVIGDLVKVFICGFVTQTIYRAQPDKVLSRT